MERTALRQAMIELLEEETGQTFSVLDEDVNLRDGLGLDSVDLVSLVIQIQTRFHIQISTEELEHIARVADLLDVVQARLAAAAAAA